MKFIVKGVQALYSVYALLLFVAILLVISPLVIVASFFGKLKGGNFICALCGVWADVWLPLVGIFHRNIYLEPHRKDHACIFVANHISYMDIPVLMKTVRQPIRVLGKMELSRIPVFGFLYRHAVVMVDRSSAENRARSVMMLKVILKKNVSIVIYPEGTFNTTGEPLKEFYNGAFRIAIETQTPIKPVIFPDSKNRLHYDSMFSLTPGISRAIFMDEVPVNGLTLADIDLLKNKVYQLMEAELRKWTASTVVTA